LSLNFPFYELYFRTNSDPVTCSPAEGSGVLCTYKNECTAAAALGNVNSCQDSPLSPGGNTCPNPPSNTGCTTDYQPVFCIYQGYGCGYSNQCLANAAGAGANCYSNNDQYCPVPPSTSGCGTQYNPVTCSVNGQSCTFGNQCLANAACNSGGGFNCQNCQTDQQCPNAAVGCSAPSGSVPYYCGSEQTSMPRVPANCWYASEACFESTGVWVANDCCKQPPLNSASSCDSNGYNPVVCGNKDCIYNNNCYAKAAGFDTSKQCGKCDPTCLDTCTSPNSQSVGQGQRPRVCKGNSQANTQSSNPLAGAEETSGGSAEATSKTAAAATAMGAAALLVAAVAL